MLVQSKSGKLLFQIISALFIIAIGVCLIVDFAVNRELTWAGYPIVSMLATWIIMLPLFFARKNKITLSLFMATATAIPMLCFLDKLTPNESWFNSLGLPIVLVSIIAIWLLYTIFRFLKMNYWFKAAAAVFLLGVVHSSIVNYYVDIYSFGDFSFFRLPNIISIITCIVVTALLTIIGFNKKQRTGLQ